MTERERRAITLFSRCGALSKREFAEKEGISWATAVKVIGRLEDAGILCAAGTSVQADTTGKDPRLYDLSDRVPLAVGVDIAPETTTLTLTNLKKAALHHEAFPTPECRSFDDLQRMLVERCTQFLEHALSGGERIEGIGIGLPRGFIRSKTPMFQRLAEAAQRKLNAPVRVAAPAHNYALYAKWFGAAFALDEFLLISLRRGLETALFFHGDVWRGEHGIAGARAFDAQPDRSKIPVSQGELYRQYLQQIRREPVAADAAFSEVDARVGLASLFSLAKDGQAEAVSILQNAAESLGKRLASLLSLLDIPSIVLAADFGADGGVWLPMITAAMRPFTADAPPRLSYLPIEPLGFAHGAALLALKDFFAIIR